MIIFYISCEIRCPLLHLVKFSYIDEEAAKPPSRLLSDEESELLLP